MQNKANFQNVQMNVTSFQIMDYGDFAALRVWKNKANSKPISGGTAAQQPDLPKILACAGRDKPRGVHIDYGGSNGHNVARLLSSLRKESSERLAKDFRRQK